MINITNSDIIDIAVGNIPIDKAYIGGQLVWENKKELLYIHNPSTAYIDTGIPWNINYEYGIVFDCKDETSFSGKTYFYAGARTRAAQGSASNAHFDIFTQNGTNIRIDIWSRVSSNHSANTKHTFIITNTSITVDDSSIATGNKTANGTLPIYLFAVNQAGSPMYPAPCNIYRYWVKDSDTYLINLIPAINDGEACFYDTVSDSYYKSPNNVSFSARYK